MVEISDNQAQKLLFALDNVLYDQDLLLWGLILDGEELDPECLEANQILHDFESRLKDG